VSLGFRGVFFTRYSAVMVLPINGNINFECGQDLYDDMDLEAPPESWDDVAAVANKAQKRYDGDVYCGLGCGERRANVASYDRQT
jgi:ABC-type glycerol-3-phosphate transport system substrate-binding protein